MTEESGIPHKKGRTRAGLFFKWYPWVVIFITVVVVTATLVPKAVAGYGKYVGQTPEQAVQKYFEDKYPEYASDDTPLLVEEYDEFTVVLYDLSSQHGQSPGEVVYYQVVRHNLAGWYINRPYIEGYFLSMYPWGELEPYLAWNMGRGPGYTVFCGKTVSDEVTSVEVDYRYGRQTKGVAVQDEWFLIALETMEWNDSIRALDADGNVLAEWVRDESLDALFN